jgi:alpha-D-xyloside xylohydrolase
MAMLNAWADGTKPWSFPEVEKAVRDVANLRMQLLPYIYSTFAQYHFEGIPPFKAMQLVEGFAFTASTVKGKPDGSENPYAMNIRQDVKDQYMMGDNLLVAPMFAGEQSRKVILPAGKWYDFYTGEFAGENQMIEVQPGLEKIPLFVRNGGIIPMIQALRHAPGKGQKLTLEIRHYGDAEGIFNLYDDDGTTFNYEKGDYSFSSLTVKKDNKGKLKGSVIFPEKDKTFGYTSLPVWKMMSMK